MFPLAPFRVPGAFLKLPQFLIPFVSATFWHAGLLYPAESKPSYSDALLFSRLYSITPKQGRAPQPLGTVRCGRAPLYGPSQHRRNLKGRMAGLQRTQIPEQVWPTDPDCQTEKTLKGTILKRTARCCLEGGGLTAASTL